MSRPGRVPTKDTLDFLIIGAQKAGTTSLFKYLAGHQNLYLPSEKELAFFTLDTRYAIGWDAFIAEWFGNAPADRLWGEASPQYMADPRAPDRIRTQLPKVKLIALLRHPVDRAVSHYKMEVRRGCETRPFEIAARTLMEPHEAAHARTLDSSDSSEARCYLAWGEYGRILQRFVDLFGSDQILIRFTDDLEHQPQTVVDAVLAFLGLEVGYIPPTLGRRYHEGGTRKLFPRLRGVLRQTPLKMFWRSLPRRHRRTIEYWYDNMNVRKDRDKEFQMSAELRDRLVEFYRTDIRTLEKLAGVSVPWPDFRNGGEQHRV